MADTREDFEKYIEEAGMGAGLSRDGDSYYSREIHNLWCCWRAALASRPAEVDDEGLPPLPESAKLTIYELQRQPYFDAEQFRQGQRDAVAADRARREHLGDDEREWLVVGGRRAGRTHIAALVRNAARYRWLREPNNVEAVSIVDMHSGDSMDARVDQAMSQADAQRDTK